MTTDIKPLLRTGVVLQSAALALNSAKLLKRRKIRTKDLVKTGTQGIIGSILIKEQSDFINGI